MDSPVTQAYLQCLKWSNLQISEVMGKNGYIDSENMEKTFSALHSAMGEKEGLLRAANPIQIMSTHKMLEVKTDDKDI